MVAMRGLDGIGDGLVVISREGGWWGGVVVREMVLEVRVVEKVLVGARGDKGGI